MDSPPLCLQLSLLDILVEIDSLLGLRIYIRGHLGARVPRGAVVRKGHKFHVELSPLQVTAGRQPNVDHHGNTNK